MPIETLTYAVFAARLKISPAAARSLAKRRRLPRTLSDDGKALVSVDLSHIRYTPRPRGGQGDNLVLPATAIAALQAEIARLEAMAASHRADFEHERERADRLMAELLQAAAETMAAKETAARLEGVLRSTGRAGGASDGHAGGTRRLASLAAELVAADRKAAR